MTFIWAFWGQGRHAETGPPARRKERRRAKDRSTVYGGDGAERPGHILGGIRVWVTSSWVSEPRELPSTKRDGLVGEASLYYTSKKAFHFFILYYVGKSVKGKEQCESD